MVVSFGGVGDNTIVAAQPGKRIIVQSLSLVFQGDATLTWKSGSTAISGGYAMKANGSMEIDPAPPGTPPELVTGVGEALVANLSIGVTVAGMIGWRAD